MNMHQEKKWLATKDHWGHQLIKETQNNLFIS